MKFNEISKEIIGKCVYICRPQNNPELNQFYLNKKKLKIFDLMKNFKKDDIILIDENFKKYRVYYYDIELCE